MPNDKSPESVSPITGLLERAGNGDREAVDEVFDRVHAELKRIARAQLSRERSDHTLTPTALVNEAYVKLVSNVPGQIQNRKHFLAIAARAMRQVLVTYATRRTTQKRGGEQVVITLDESGHGFACRSAELLALDRALNELETRDPQMARIVEYRFFAGLAQDEIASLLSVSPSTVGRAWRAARAWLRQAMV